MTIDIDSARFSRILRAAIFWPVALIFLTGLPLLLLAFQLFHVISSSDHSYAVLEQTRQCESLTIGLQNQVRGYLLTGAPAFVTSFDQQQHQLDDAFTQLKTLVMDNPQQIIRVDDLIQTKNTWLEHARSSVTQRSQSKPVDANWILMGKSMMDEVVTKFDRFTAVEEDLRRRRLQRVERMKQVLVYGGGALLILLSLGVGQLVRRNFINLATQHREALRTIEQRHAALARSEADLEEQKEWFRVTLTSIGDGVIVTDREGRIVFMNQEAERLTDWKSIEAMLKPLPSVFKIINEDSRKPVEDPVTKVFREKKVVGLANHTVLISSLGQEWPIEDSAAPIYDAKGQMLGVVLVFHNATETRHAQNTLRAHSEDLERKVADRTLNLQQTVTELEAFSYTISHDLRSPLRAMQGFAEAVIEDYADQIDDRGKGYLNRIKNAAVRLDRLIQDLLAYTRISRQETAPLVPLDMDKLLRDIIEHYPNFNSPEVHIEIAGTLPHILGREAALTQVLSNLLGNAIKFVPPGAHPRIKVWAEDRGSRVRLWIQDNGIGIAEKDFDRIFQMFTQINDSALYGGTGVGLAIVKKAMQTMQGTIGLQSEPGRGSQFWIELLKATP